MQEYSDAEKRQKLHYDSIASTYADHYGDKWSQCYRRKFFNEPMLGDVDANFSHSRHCQRPHRTWLRSGAVYGNSRWGHSTG